MEILLVSEPIPLAEVAARARSQFGEMIKAAVDVERCVMALGGELHSDEEALLLQDGSAQANIWGLNLYPGKDAADWIEFDAMINVRPSQNNRSRGVEDPGLRARIQRVVEGLVKR